MHGRWLETAVNLFPSAIGPCAFQGGKRRTHRDAHTATATNSRGSVFIVLVQHFGLVVPKRPVAVAGAKTFGRSGWHVLSTER